MAWLREKGELGFEGGPVRKRKSLASSSSASSEDAAGLVQLSGGNGGAISAVRVLSLASQLGLLQPVYVNAEPEPLTPSLFTVSAKFPESGLGDEEEVVATARRVLKKGCAGRVCQVDD